MVNFAHVIFCSSTRSVVSIFDTHNLCDIRYFRIFNEFSSKILLKFLFSPDLFDLDQIGEIVKQLIKKQLIVGHGPITDEDYKWKQLFLNNYKSVHDPRLGKTIWSANVNILLFISLSF